MGEVEDLSTRDLLAAVKAGQEIEDRATAQRLELAAAWADRHPPESIGGEAVFIHGEHVEPIAGPGCPLVAEFCLAELGAVLGVSTTAAKRLVGHALELRHRLPLLSAAVQAGRLPAWRARLVAEATIHTSPALTPETMGWIDAQVAPFAARLGQAQVDRIVAEAIRRQSPPEPVDPDDPPMPDQRHVTVDLEQVQVNGTVTVTGEVDLADGIDLDRVLSQRAAALTALGAVASLDARRAMALGDLARTQLALDLSGRDAPVGAAGEPATTWKRETVTHTAREVVLHLHFDAGTSPVTGKGEEGIDWLGRMEQGQRLVLLDQVKAWCGQSHTRVTVKPVIDLNTEIATASYTPTERLAEQVRLRDRTCVFPWCTRPAPRCDLDHVEPFDHQATAQGRPQPGPTTTTNLACLCRRHHRLKTHGHWRVRALGSGVIEWTSPHGHRFLRDHTGTRTTDQPSTGADHPDEPPPRP